MDNSNLNSGRHRWYLVADGTKTIVMRDTGSTTCVVKKSLVKPEQMTGSYELCMLIDGIVKRYPTAMVKLDTPYFSGRTKVLCMDNPVQDIIIGNIPGASGVHPNLVNTKATVKLWVEVMFTKAAEVHADCF